MTIKHLYPNARPSLDLKFAKDKVLDPRITYSRASSGTYFDSTGLLKSAATNQARFDHDPTTGESLGLLVEEARTNLVTYSEDLTAWASAFWNVVPNATSAPDDSITADLAVANGATSQSLGINVSVVAGTTYTASIFAKAKEFNSFVLRPTGSNSHRCEFELVGDGNTAPVTGTAKIIRLPGSWYYCSYTFAEPTGGARQFGIQLGFSEVSDGVSGIYIWGAQLEAGSFPTSYIPTPATFTSRSTTATYYDANGTIQTAGIDVARDNAYLPDENGVFKPAGLLLEAAGTNNALNSENVSLWNNFRITTGTDTLVAPDGISKPVYYIENTSTIDSISRIGTASTTSGNSSSVFLKARSGSTWVAVGPGQYANGFDGWNVYVNLADGSIGTIGSQLTYSSIKVTKLPNSWYRVEINNHNNQLTTPNQALWVAVVEGDGVRGTPSGGTHSYYVWGGQFEDNSSFVSSYIPTAGSTVTRAADVSTSATVTRSADVAQITGANFSSWYNQSEGTVFADTTDLGYPTNAVGSLWKIFASSSHVSGRNSINMFRYSGGTLPEARFGIVDQNAVTQVDLVTASPPTSAKVKSAIGLQSGSYAATSHGNTVVTSSAAVPPTYVAADTLAFGQATNSTLQQKSCLIARLTYYPVRLPDATLQSITS